MHGLPLSGMRRLTPPQKTNLLLDGYGSLDSYAPTTLEPVLSCSFLFQQASPQGTVAQGSCSLLTCSGTISHTHDRNITSCLKPPLARITWSCRQLPSVLSS